LENGGSPSSNYSSTRRSSCGLKQVYVLQIFWKVSNNEAEYEALLHGLRLTASLGIKQLQVYGDSAVVINQVNKS
jgi:ribonuclease HI